MESKNAGIKVFAPAIVKDIGPSSGIFCAAMLEAGIDVRIRQHSEKGIKTGELTGARAIKPEDAWKPLLHGITCLLQETKQENTDLIVHLHYRMPVAAGLSEDIVSLVAGVMAANEILRRPFEKAQLMPVIESSLAKLNLQARGYVAKACLSGGLVLDGAMRGREGYLRMPIPKGLQLLVFAADIDLIYMVSVLESVSNDKAARSAAFVHSLYMADFDLMKNSMSNACTISGPWSEVIDEVLKRSKSVGYGISNDGSAIWSLFINTLDADEVMEELSSLCKKNHISYSIWLSGINQEGAIKC
jgi:homoserine kinase